ncbi:MAG: class I SAM-dependent methyltransferase [Patescibacteria group bacterium]
MILKHPDLSPDYPIIDRRRTEKLYKDEFKRHLRAYDLTPADLQGKRILDIASGLELYFPIAAAMAGFENVYSLDIRKTPLIQKAEALHYHEAKLYPHLRRVKENIPPKILESVKQKYVQANAEKLPFKDQSFDLILSRYAIPLILLPERKKAARQAIQEILRVLKNNGQFRFFSVEENFSLKENIPKELEKFLVKFMAKNVALNELLEKMAQEKLLEYETKNVYQKTTKYFRPKNKEGLLAYQNIRQMKIIRKVKATEKRK